MCDARVLEPSVAIEIADIGHRSKNTERIFDSLEVRTDASDFCDQSSNLVEGVKIGNPTVAEFRRAPRGRFREPDDDAPELPQYRNHLV